MANLLNIVSNSKRAFDVLSYRKFFLNNSSFLFCFLENQTDLSLIQSFSLMQNVPLFFLNSKFVSTVFNKSFFKCLKFKTLTLDFKHLNIIKNSNLNLNFLVIYDGFFLSLNIEDFDLLYNKYHKNFYDISLFFLGFSNMFAFMLICLKNFVVSCFFE
jgi:hypothetical protein